MSNALANPDRPTGFATLAVQSDPKLVDEADTAVQASAGPVHPQWSWHFTSSSTWLATVLALNSATASPPGPATRLVFTVQPSATLAGSPISPAVKVAAQNDAGTTDPSFTGSVTVALGTPNPSGGTLSGTKMVTAVNGVATFSTLSIDKPGNGYTLQATATVAGATSAATSAAFNITASPPPSPPPTGTGITLAVPPNGSLNEFGRLLIKGFNPDNPHHGDAVVATFVWKSATSSNIIDSVSDVLTTTPYTPVGNKYTLVEFVSTGGVSMATYIATNVQGFPEGRPASNGDILAVRADLTDSVSGGVQITAWTGVNAVTAQALGAHHSASGSGTGSTVADPGTLSVNAGALAYVITMSNAFTTVSQTSTGFGMLAEQSDGNQGIKDHTDTLVQTSLGTAHPQWTWNFPSSSPSTWLASVIALNPGAAPPANQPPTANFPAPSCSGLTCSFTSTSTDPDGTVASYTWTFGDGTPASTLQNPSHTYGAGGSYTVTLTVTDNQGATSAPFSRSVPVSPTNQAPTASFPAPSCSGLTCSFTSTSTDPDGTIASYNWTFGDGCSSTAQNPSHTYGAGGSYTVTLTVTDRKSAAKGPFARSGTRNQPPTASFSVPSCSGLTCNFTS